MVFQQQFLISHTKCSIAYRLTSRIGWIVKHSNVQKCHLKRNLCLNKVSNKRFLFSGCNGVWENAVSTELLKEIDVYWKEKVPKEVREAQDRIPGVIANKCDDNKKSHDYYVLSMFPYPSGQLHMGHVRVYSISDAMAHYYRMSGPYRVLHPMGWDAFGLPAENAAIKRDIKPQDWTASNVAKMREQLDSCGFLFDWDRELSTCDPSYYKWTQWIFLKMYEAGLAYQKEAMVNWDPVDQTVLADEQVDAEGRSWRSGAKVEKRPLKQWFLRTTEYSKDLYDGLDDPTLKDWRDIIKIQRNWIGECNGVKFQFALKNVDMTDSKMPTQNQQESSYISVWTDCPEMVLGVGFIGISSEHILMKSVGNVEEKDVFSAFGHCFYRLRHVAALNPFFPERTPIPILVFTPEATFDESELKLFPSGSDSFLGIPANSDAHAGILETLFTDENSEQPKKILSENGTLQNCGEFSGLRAGDESKKAILEYARKHRIGGYWTSSKLQDWPISRQRYWGTPIPMVRCSHGCGVVPVKEEELPVILPDLDTLTEKKLGVEGGGSPLLRATEWITTDCPKCGKPGAKRETDTLDTFVDSAWYFLRYLDPNNDHKIIETSENNCEDGTISNGMPVDLYIGGKEHATLHLYFARFVTHFLHSIGVCPVKEPFQSLLVQGMVKGQSFRIKGSGEYIPKSQVDFQSQGGSKETGGSSRPVDMVTKKPLVVEWKKMSKSKYNGADPAEVLEKYGMDTTRLLILSDVSPLSDRKWDPEDSLVRIRNMQSKLLRLIKIALSSTGLKEKESGVDNVIDCDAKENNEEAVTKALNKLWDARNFYVRGANHAYSETRNLSMVMSRVQGLLSELSSAAVIPNISSSLEYRRGLANAIILLTPLAPHFCAEMWTGLSRASTMCIQNNVDLHDDFLWERSVFHQPWPKMDSNYNLKLLVRKNGEDLTEIPIAVWRFADLNEEDAFNLACCVDVVQESVLPHQDSLTHSFTLQPNYEAVIDFHIKPTGMTAEEKAHRKEAKREEKLAKKIAREARIAERVRLAYLKAERD